MNEFLKTFWSNETGATAIEYGIIASLISIAIVGALHQMGPALSDMFQIVIDGFDN